MNGPHPAAAVRRARADAATLVAHHFGSPARRIVRQGGGLTNLVFAVDHPAGALVVRLNPAPDKAGGFIKEQWATRRAREAGVPTPEVLEVGHAAGGSAYMIARRVRGEPATRHPERMRILHEMGRLTAAINAIPTDGWGETFDWSHNRLSYNPSWHAFLERELCVEHRLETLARLAGLDAARARRVRAALQALGALQPALAHGDMRLKNVIVDARGAVVAVIDWDECRSAPAPHWDLAIALHDLSIDEKRAFVAGRGIDDETLVGMSAALRALNLMHYAQVLERAHAQHEASECAHLRARLAGAFDLYGP